MSNRLDTHRQAHYTVTLLDWGDQVVRRLDGVTGGNITLSNSTRLRASGSLNLTQACGDIDWMTQRVRIDYTANGVSWGLGVFLLSAPTRTYSEMGSTWSVDLSSPLAVPDADCVDSTFTVKAGTNLVGVAADILYETGLERLSITPSTAVASSDMIYDPGKSKLTIVNELLSAAGYWSAHPDGEGQVHLDPYVRPAARGVAYGFHEGARSIHLPEWEREQDMAAVPNKVVFISQGSADKPALVGVAVNDDSSSPYSYPSRGRWVVETRTGVEAADQESITAQARRRLIDVSTPSAAITLQHMPVPIQPNQVVGFTSQGHAGKGVVKEIEYALDPTALVKTKLLEVTDL
jgi:hypothetical protein